MGVLKKLKSEIKEYDGAIKTDEDVKRICSFPPKDEIRFISSYEAAFLKWLEDERKKGKKMALNYINQ